MRQEQRRARATDAILVADLLNDQGGVVSVTRHRGPALRTNDRFVLDSLCEAGPLSRTELRTRTNLSQPTILEAVNRLADCGALIKAGRGAGGRRGPNAQLYDIDARLKVAAGVAVSAAEIQLRVVDLRGHTVAAQVQPLNAEESAEQVSDLVIDMTRRAGIDEDQLAHVVVGMHGQIERRTGDLGFAWDLPLWEHSTITTLRSALPCPVTLERDVELAAAAEHVAGSTQGLQNFGVLWIGTGLGYAGHVDGTPLRGSTGAAGQIGYMPTPGMPSPPLPERHDHTVGYHGGLQASIGSEALQALADKLGAADPWAAIAHPSPLQEAYSRRVALGLAAATALLDPGTVALSGPIGYTGGSTLATAVSAHLAQIAPSGARVVAGRFGLDGVLRGALELAAREARDVAWGTPPP